MVTIDYVRSQLQNLGVTVTGWGVAELHELVNILMPHESIQGYVHGWYENGFATLVATSERLLLVDKKLFHLTIEDVRYDMIAEVDYNAHVLDSTIRVTCVNKILRFTSLRQHRLRALTNYIQQRVMELRQNFSWQQFEQTPVPEYGPVPRAMATIGAAVGTGGPSLPLAGPDLTHVRHVPAFNPYTKNALITKYKFLPKVPRRFRSTA